MTVSSSMQPDEHPTIILIFPSSSQPAIVMTGERQKKTPIYQKKATFRHLTRI